jgi:hypothetical protein
LAVQYLAQCQFHANVNCNRRLKPATKAGGASTSAPWGEGMFELLRQIWALALARRKIFLIPLIFGLVLVGALLVLAEGSAVAPFIYALF